jgi:hypothetical protein
VLTFTLDANGNRLSDGQGSKTYSPNSNRMATLDGHSVVLDAAGHTLQARGLVIAWNQAGQLKSVSQGPTLLASYFYDHRDLRTRKTTTARLSMNREEFDLDSNLATAVFRIVQEALTNVARHAEAGEVSVSIDETDEGIDLVVTDDGRGIAASGNKKTFGLLGMRERITILGGTLEIDSQPERGTRIACRLPLTKDKQA